MPKSRSPSTPVAGPEKKIGPFAGGISVAIWLNTIQTDDGPRKIRSVTVSPRRYRDSESGEWRDSNSLRPGDLPALIFALQKAQEYVYTTPIPGQDDQDQEPESF